MRSIFLITFAVVVAACAQHASPATTALKSNAPATPQAPSVEPTATPSAALQPLPAIDFGAHGLAQAGCFLLRDLSSGSEQVSSVERCAQGRRPNSTFKIVNALIGADLGLLSGPDAIMKWDAKRYPKQDGWFEGWDRDQPLREAMRISSVPLFRKLAVDIGPERMAQYLETLEYGNRDMSAGLDSFWLQGNMRITATQQVDLISGLVREELPVSKQAQAIVKQVLKKEPIAGAPHAGKTGSGGLETPDSAQGKGAMVGWMVGFIELARGPVAYAMWVEAPSFDAMRDLRTRTVDAVLTDVVKQWK